MPSEPPRVHDDTNGASLALFVLCQLFERRLCVSQLREDWGKSPDRVFVACVDLVDQSFECLPAFRDRPD